MMDTDTLAMAAWARFNDEDRFRQSEVAKILRANFEVVWDGTFDHVAKQIVIALRTIKPPPPPAEFQFAEAFQSLTMRCFGYDEEIKALKRQLAALQEADHGLKSDIRALQDRVHEHEEFPELEPK